MPQFCFGGLHVMGIAADKAINRHADVSEQAKVVNQGCIPYPQQRGCRAGYPSDRRDATSA